MTKSKGIGRHPPSRRTHGASYQNKKATPEYDAWSSMKKRCLNKTLSNYPRYGGRGITICDRWLNSFENFLADMGLRPSARHSLDRLDNDGNYEPQNCAWRTVLEQAANRSNVYRIEFDGEILTAAQVAKRCGRNRKTIVRRIAQGAKGAELFR